MKKLVIEKSALKKNLAVIKAAAGRSCIYANLSRDAYGAGAVDMAKLLREEGISHFAVDDVDVAIALRKAGLVEEEILMLRSISDRKELEKLLDHNIVCSIGNLETGVALNALAAERATVAEAHIQIDCGMGLGGFAAEEPEKISAVYRNLSSVAVSGIYTHLFSSEKAVTDQLASFNHALTSLRDAGYETGTAHAAGSYSLLHHESSRLDAVRAGSVLMGRCRRQKGDGLEPLGFGETVITDIRWLPKGHTISSRKLKTLRRATRIAAIPVGFHNGFGITPPPRTLWDSIVAFFRSRKYSVQIHDQKVRVLGSIGGSETLLDVTDIRCTEGDHVTFVIDPQFARGFKREYR